jgi:broad specificity phosphatase PhoE
MSFIFIRHLPTAYNQQGLLQGQCNQDILPLTAALALEITANNKRLNKLTPFNKLLCSSLSRTQQTAEAYGYSTEVEPLLDELNFGCYQGKLRHLMLNDIGTQWHYDPASLKLGEPVSALLERIQHYMAKYNHHSDQGNVLAFAHGAWMRAAQVWYQQGSLNSMNQIKINNNALLIIEPENTYV